MSVHTVKNPDEIDLRPHVKSFPADLRFARLNDRIICALVGVEPPETGEMYEVVGQTRNPRAMASCDALAFDGTFVEPYTDGPLVKLQHPRAGRYDSFHAEEWLDEPVLKLRRLPGAAQL